MPLTGIRGHLELARRLLSELQARPSHAYLFSGPRGVGKALVANALAHAMLCERSPGESFCCTPGRCPVRMAPATERTRARAGEDESPRCECCAACVQVAAGVHPDFTYIARPEGRTDVLIEQVRALIVQLGQRPVRGAVRIAVIDDAETLNLPAQNALLKTLEEPPGRAIIFMITASERALLDTVRSRMRTVRFRALGIEDLEAILAERGVAGKERCASIARLARGSAARAIALMDGDEPPMDELIAALAAAKSIDFPRAQSIAQSLFGTRDEAAANFELLARLLEEILCYKLLENAPDGGPSKPPEKIAALAGEAGIPALVECIGGAVRAIEAVEAMANPRLQAESWWMAAGRTMRSQ
jgi:DNA polymerase III subunit delta'